jgi:hypothetical protein
LELGSLSCATISLAADWDLTAISGITWNITWSADIATTIDAAWWTLVLAHC